MKIKLALAGNPNSGKTTLFNALTGSSQYVGNWPGVTVEKKEGNLKGSKDVTVTDLPGIYSLSPYTLEEVVTRDYLLNEQPDVIINIVDASNIERNLYLTTQLIELGIPVIIALNMMDIVLKNGDSIDTKKLASMLGCQVVETSAIKGDGIKEVAEKAVEMVKLRIKTQPPHSYHESLEKALSTISDHLSIVETQQKRWYAIKIFERDSKAMAGLSLGISKQNAIEAIIANCEQELDDDAESIVTNERYNYISNVIRHCVKHKKTGLSTSDKIDRIVTNRWLALPIFALVMWTIYYISISSLGAIVTDWTNDFLFGGLISDFATTSLTAVGAADWLISLIVDGIIGGVGAVLGFLPQMLILFFFLSILEDCGYMARVAFIMDRIFRKFGLSGKSFIPLMISSGCGVPGIMASRTIENESDRKLTIMVTTFIPCGAKLPIIALIAGAIFSGASWVAPSMYFLGIAMVLISGIILKKTRLFSGDPAPFVMELPQYRIPGLKGVLTHMWERSKSFVIKAGTVIFVACTVIWFLQTFNWNLQMVDSSESVLAGIGMFLAPFFAPLGFGTWQATVATITGLVAKENVVGTFGVLYGFSEVAGDGVEIWSRVAADFTVVSAAAFLIFNMLCAPCFAAIGAIKREMGSWKWTWITLAYQTTLAYITAYIVNQIGSLIILKQSFNGQTFIALALIAVVVWLLARPAHKETPALVTE
ncbi:ferrous iron transport protein B [Acetobacterium woodii]|uniref:Ferrous iron transport protein B n=1 Tax=Acetobacterium woodii (strain ATCC 29683 / DSM 1030 / JCM 2381 / KCTC 1655 / WB1) TaxID=931626 RepID=H6LHX8_ACEWD|nr:ferrous iron transport protein B [Acetobacterium woodii]AFA48508.1 ferrous iron transport protein FeoB1 [Acetobacterium woodii DSM 1030]